MRACHALIFGRSGRVRIRRDDRLRGRSASIVVPGYAAWRGCMVWPWRKGSARGRGFGCSGLRVARRVQEYGTPNPARPRGGPDDWRPRRSALRDLAAETGIWSISSRVPVARHHGVARPSRRPGPARLCAPIFSPARVPRFWVTGAHRVSVDRLPSRERRAPPTGRSRRDLRSWLAWIGVNG